MTTTTPLPAAPTVATVAGAGPPMIDARDLTRVWGRGRSAQTAVDRVDLRVEPGELVAIVGPSGSGKSTLGSLLAGIDRPTSGSLVVGGARIDRLRDDALARWRGRHVGIVFQDFHLLPTLTATENVELALQLTGRLRRRRAAARAALAAVGLADRANRLPSQLSGGEQQRVGIARALAVDPVLLVADEPTGSLDQRSGHAVFSSLLDIRCRGTTVVLITHDGQLARSADRIVTLVDGRVVSDQAGGDRGGEWRP
jgi:putative ABC transport system ATP-binding protein